VKESEQKYKITIKPFSDGKLIHAYESNPEFGYVVLESDEPFFCPTLFDVYLKSSDVKSIRFPKRQAFLRGRIETIKKLVDAASKVNNLPGRIRIQEFLEDEIPEDVKKANIRDDMPFEEAIKPYLLVFKPKNDSIENRIRDRFRVKSNDKFLTKNGKRIVRFFIYQMDYKADLLIKGFDINFEPKTPIFTCNDLPVNETEEREINENPLSQNTDLDEILTTSIQNNKNERKETTTTIKEDKFSELKSVDTKKERSQESIKRKNRIATPIFLILLVGSIVLMINIPSIFTFIAVIFGSLVIFYFAGGFYEAIFSKNAEFNLLRTILVGVVVIIIIGIIIFISELTKTPNDPDMWRHP
jgi:hypothetical protein